MDTLLLALRVLVSLGAVLAVLWFARRWLTGGKAARARGKEITIVAKQGLGAKASVALVEAGGARYLLGVTEHSVTVLDKLEPELQRLQPAPPTTPIVLPSFARALEKATEETRALEPLPLVPASRRSTRQAEAAGKSPLAGSLLSPDTWRQTALALRRTR